MAESLAAGLIGGYRSVVVSAAALLRLPGGAPASERLGRLAIPPLLSGVVLRQAACRYLFDET